MLLVNRNSKQFIAMSTSFPFRHHLAYRVTLHGTRFKAPQKIIQPRWSSRVCMEMSAQTTGARQLQVLLQRTWQLEETQELHSEVA